MALTEKRERFGAMVVGLIGLEFGKVGGGYLSIVVIC